ncbi:MAG: alkaline phosphatase family protein [Candidatus Omnitrophota bacterium]
MILQYVDPGSGYAFLNMSAWMITLLAGLFGAFIFFLRGIFRFIKKHKKPLMAAVIALILAGALIGVFMKKTASPFDKKIIVLGMDALSPEIIEPMIRQGKLPNFARLKAMGSYDRLATTNPPQSPVAWAAFATGKNPGKNGIFDFIKRDPRTYGVELVFSGMDRGRPVRVLKAKGFWDYTSQRKVPTVVLACPDTFPAEKIFGRMLSGMGVPDILGTQGTFTFYTSEPLNTDQEMGGKVFPASTAQIQTMHLIGPRTMGPGGTPTNVRVPFKLTLQDKSRAAVEFQHKRTELEVGQWSGWNEVEFSLGFLKKTRGIFKFYLVETEPELKLYISPINFDPRSPLFPISYPENYSRELADRLGLYYTQGMPMDTWVLNEKRLSEKAFLQQAEEVHRERKAALDLELGRLKGGVLFCYFESVDIIQHMFWRYTDPQHPLYDQDAAEEYKEEIETWYKRMDDVLGDVLGRLGSQDTLIVLSDHGFGTFRRTVHLNNWLAEKGYLVRKESGEATEQIPLNGIDWSRTRAYALGFGGIYVNQKGRESQGIVEPGEETKTLKDKIASELKTWNDEKYAAPVVKNVYKQENIFRGPYAKEAPDLYVGFNPGYRASWQTAVGGMGTGLIEDNLKKWSGDHLFDPAAVPGVIFLNKKIIQAAPSICDITPTILKASGYTDEEIKERDFDGRPLF